jgi:hypothetical protein
MCDGHQVPMQWRGEELREVPSKQRLKTGGRRRQADWAIFAASGVKGGARHPLAFFALEQLSLTDNHTNVGCNYAKAHFSWSHCGRRHQLGRVRLRR